MVVPKGIRVTKHGKTDRNSRVARLMSPAPLAYLETAADSFDKWLVGSG
jgi:hypothetical protein